MPLYIPFCPNATGHGIFTGADGVKYGGGFKAGALHGRGVYEQKDGRKYDGEFVGNRRNGQGSSRAADGSQYDGGWKNDVYHGQCTSKSIARVCVRACVWVGMRVPPSLVCNSRLFRCPLESLC